MEEEKEEHFEDYLQTYPCLVFNMQIQFCIFSFLEVLMSLLYLFSSVRLSGYDY